MRPKQLFNRRQRKITSPRASRPLYRIGSQTPGPCPTLCLDKRRSLSPVSCTRVNPAAEISPGLPASMSFNALTCHLLESADDRSKTMLGSHEWLTWAVSGKQLFGSGRYLPNTKSEFNSTLSSGPLPHWTELYALGLRVKLLRTVNVSPCAKFWLASYFIRGFKCSIGLTRQVLRNEVNSPDLNSTTKSG